MNLDLPVQPDDVIADKYVVEGVIGEGAVGVVVAARHRQLRQRVAIKFLRPELAQRLEVAERFRRRARAAAAVTSEHVCRVLDVSTNDGGLPYVVMEYAEGRDLAGELAERESFAYAEAVDYALQACEGLAEGLVAGIVHGDLKPSKLYLTRRQDGSRCVKLLDLGTSELSNDTPARLQASLQQTAAEQAATWLQAFEYLAPEQLVSPEQVSPATNVWALGAMLYRMLSGRAPFAATKAAELAQALQDEPVMLANCDAPEALVAVVQRALAKRVIDRHASIAELAQALAPFAPPRARISAERVSRLLPPMAAEARPTSAAGMERAAASRTKPRPRRGLVIAALIPPALGLWFWLSRDEVIAPAPVATSTMRTESPVPAVDVARTSESEDVNEPVAVAENEAVAVAVEQDASLPAEVAPQVPRRRAIAVRSQPSAIGPRAYVGPFHVSDFGGRR